MKIIGKDNFGRESVADILVCENVCNDYLGNIMVATLNEEQGDDGNTFFDLVSDDYRLWRGMEELV